MTPKRTRRVVRLGWCLLLCFAIAAAWLGGIGPHVRSFQLAYLIGFVGYLLLVWAVARAEDERMLGSWRWWLVGAIVLRAVLMPAAPSDDAWRYAWEGRVQKAGFSPYMYAPDAAELTHLRDGDWSKINHPDFPAIYPPAAEAEFLVASIVYDSTYTTKILHVVWDILTVVLLGAILRRLGMKPHLAVLYGLCPLVLTAFAVEGHVDSLMLLFAAICLWAEASGRRYLAGIALGLSIASKLMFVVFWPWFLLRDRRVAFVAVATVAVCYVPYWDGGLGVLKSLTRFGLGETFFSLSGTLFELLGLDGIPRGVLCGVLAMVLFVLAWRETSFRAFARSATSALILLLPIVHYWYLSWVLMFLVLRPSFAWLCAALTLVVYFEAEHTRTMTGEWAMPPWCAEVFWSVFLLSWGLAAVKRFRSHRRHETGSTTDAH